MNTPGGGTVHSLGIAHALRELGVDVWFVTVSAHPTQPGIWPSDRLIEVKPFGLTPLLNGIPVAQAIKQLNSAFPIDAVLGWQHETVFLSNYLAHRKIPLALIASTPYRQWKHRNTPFKFFKNFSDEIFRWKPLRNADLLFPPSEFTKNELISLFGLKESKIKVIPAAVDPVFLTTNAQPPQGDAKLVYCGNIKLEKGVFDMLEALGILYKKGITQWKLEMIGWGKLEEARQHVARAGISDKVLFLGTLDRAPLSLKYATSNIAIMPSHSETFGLTIAEAQAVGLPVISTTAGAIPEVVQNGVTGLLVEPGNVYELAKAIEWAINHPDAMFEMGLKAKHLVREKFTWEKSARTTLEILENFIAGQH